MAGPYVFFRCVAEAVAAQGVRGLAELVPYGGQVYDLAKDVLDRYRACKKADEQQVALRQEVERALAEKPADLERDLRHTVDEALPALPAEDRERLTQYLTLVPVRMKLAFGRADDVGGTTVPATVALHRPDDLAAVLPPRLPRFRAGDSPPNAPKWQLVERLGVGGFGEVWKAKHIALADRFSAFKFCLDPEAQERLVQHEARVVNQVMTQADHPDIVKLLDVDFHAETPWLQFEYVPGGDLATLVAQWPSDPDKRRPLALASLRSLAQTVAFCHGLTPPVVHRDLKPTNILVERTPQKTLRLRVTDFGIGDVVARQALAEATRMTLSTPSLLRWAHTPLYASPQQKAGDSPRPSDDVHALGVLGYQLFVGNTSQPMGHDWRDDLHDIGVSSEVIDMIGRCVTSKVEKRLPDAAELCRLLAAPTQTTGGGSLDRQLDEAFRDAEKKNAQARQLLDGRDFAGALATLETISVVRLRDAAVQQQATQQRNRSAALEKEIRARALSGEHDGLTDVIDELLSLVSRKSPLHAEMTRTRDRLKQREPKGLPKAGTVITDAFGMKFVVVPKGTFWMGGGGGKPGTELVTIDHDFALGINPVTQEQWQAVMGKNPSFFSRTGGGKDQVEAISDADLRQFPVEQVSWDDVQEFLRRLNENKAENPYLYRLPTEAEWEYSCREGATSQAECGFDFYVGATPSNDLSSKDANFDASFPGGEAPKGPYLERTSKVGSYPSNRLGLHDMHGNVWEWTATSEGSDRVVRGGSWNDYGQICAAALRCRIAPEDAFRSIGFRLARSVRPVSEPV